MLPLQRHIIFGKGGDGVQKIDWRQSAAITVTLLGAATAVYLLGRYAVAILLPFLIAFALSLITRPLVVRLVACGCKERVAAVAVTALALLLFGALGYLLCSRLISELRGLLSFLVKDSEDPQGRIASLVRSLQGIRERIPGLRQGATLLGEDAEAFFKEQMRNGLARLSQRITELAVAAVRALPSVLLFLPITVISCFYFAVDHGTVGNAINRLLPPKMRCGDWRLRVGAAVRRYLRAYLLLFLLTAGELLLGFLILDVRYAFLLALVTAVLDALPVLGVGVVLVPYAAISLISGNTALGVGLLLLYGVITVVRQIAEPRLVGKSLGLHPILMLVSFYAGWKLFGVAGVFIGPLLVMIIKALWRPKEQQN